LVWRAPVKTDPKAGLSIGEPTIDDVGKTTMLLLFLRKLCRLAKIIQYHKQFESALRPVGGLGAGSCQEIRPALGC